MINNEKGRSMIEMLGVLSITGILSMSGISLYSKALHHRKISNTIEQVSELMANMRNTFRSRRTFELDSAWESGTYTAAGDDKNLIPKSMVRDGKIIVALGTPVKLADKGGKKFTIMLEDTGDLKSINKAACLKIVTSDWGHNIFIGVSADATEDSYQGTVPISDANSKCNKDANKIQFLVR